MDMVEGTQFVIIVIIVIVTLFLLFVIIVIIIIVLGKGMLLIVILLTNIHIPFLLYDVKNTDLGTGHPNVLILITSLLYDMMGVFFPLAFIRQKMCLLSLSIYWHVTEVREGVVNFPDNHQGRKMIHLFSFLDPKSQALVYLDIRLATSCYI